MQLKRRVALGGTQLDSLDNRILISGIDEAAGKETISAVSVGAGNGQRITGRRRDTLDITIKFTMNIKNSDMAARSTLLDKVNKWAQPGGVLTVGHRSGKRLNVVLAQAPGGGDMFNWTNEYTVVFRAYTVPYWENTVADVTIVNKSGDTLDAVSLTINNCIIGFSGLGLANNGSLVIDHVTAGGVYAMRAKIGTTSVLAKKTGADEFVMKPGANSISWTAGGDVAITVSARGRYL